MPNWTNDQSLAINTSGGKIIVSAAAGSGKTAVLSERVLNKVLNGTSIDKMLIVTFTVKAAEEMKTRIKNNLIQAYEKDPSNTYLKNQISLVDISSITNMDAFYNSLVRNNFDKLNIDKNFDVLNTEEDNILKDKVLSKLLEESFNDEFISMLEFFGAKDGNLVKDIIYKLSEFLDTIVDSDKFINNMLDNYKTDYYKKLLFDFIDKKISDLSNLYDEVIEELELDEVYKKVLSLAIKERNYINNISKVNSLNELSSKIRLIGNDRLNTPTGHKDDPIILKYKSVRNYFKDDLIKKFLKEISCISDEEYEKEQNEIYSTLNLLIKITMNYKDKLLLVKNKLNKYTFNDISHMCLKLLIKDNKKTPLAEFLTNKYDEILIDEYQDTNNLQNKIFNLISKDGNNLFIVGDVKQSIYGFRNAKPEIFNNDKELAYKDSFPRLITLSKNFRSRGEVLDFCNFIFENVMTKDFGEVDYNEDEKLYLGANYVESNNLDTEVIIIDGNKDKEETEDDDLTNLEKEAIVVADKIKELIDSNYQVYDRNTNSLRNIKPSDIAILSRTIKNDIGSSFKEALNKRNISVYLEESSEYFDNYEVKFIINLLKVINNPYDDIALISYLTSDVIGISYNLIADARDNKYISLYDSLINYNNDEINKYLDDIKRYRKLSYNMKISELISIIYNENNIIPILSAYKGGINRQKNLEQMIKHANDFESKKLSSLYEFITYIENVLLSKGSLEGINPLSEGDNVLITTIHKSKGLEYPVVFLVQAGKKFNPKNLNNDIMINEDLGFATNIRDNNYMLKYLSIPMILFKNKEKSNMLSEELRVLYVALTRAKEKIFITGYVGNLDNKINSLAPVIGNNRIISNICLENTKNYMDIILPCLLRHKDGSDLRDLSLYDLKVFQSDSKVNIKVVSAYDIDESEFLEKIKNDKVNMDINWVNNILNTNYLEDTIPKYLSVSDIKKHNGYLRNPNFLNDGISHTNLGTLYHKIFELLPVKKYNIKSLEEELLNLKNNNYITEEDLKLISIEKIFAYLTTDLYDELLNADEVYKEMKIDFKIPSNYYDKTLKDGMILVSAIIDLLYVKDDSYVIVDYKTDDVDDVSKLKDLYKVQLDLYEIAIRSKMKKEKIKKYIYSVKLNKYIEV